MHAYIQACIDCVVNPPKPGEPSHDSFMAEKQGVLKSLAERARLVTDNFNAIPGIHCNVVQGAMYAFPRLDLPHGLIDKAKVSRAKYNLDGNDAPRVCQLYHGSKKNVSSIKLH